MSDTDSLVEELSSLYGSINNLDSYLGGLAEASANEGVVGPLFAASIKD